MNDDRAAEGRVGSHPVSVTELALRVATEVSLELIPSTSWLPEPVRLQPFFSSVFVGARWN
jgi:hypothetical protein